MLPQVKQLQQAFNNNNLKLSYSCTANIHRKINGHNKKVIRKEQEDMREGGCNCRGGRWGCPVQGKCLTKEVIYQVEVGVEGEMNKVYVGATATTFKAWYIQQPPGLGDECGQPTAGTGERCPTSPSGSSTDPTSTAPRRGSEYASSLNKRTDVLAKC